MVRLYEFQGKRLLREAGIKVPRGDVASSKEDVRRIANEIGGPVAIKAQIWATGRFRAGGIKFAENDDEAEMRSQELLGVSIKGHKVTQVLVEEKIDVDKEFYAGVIIESSHKVKAPVIVVSDQGGVDLEEVAKRNPKRIVRMSVDYLAGLDISNVERMISKLQIADQLRTSLARVLDALYKLFVKYDARALEVNPLVLTKSGEILATDCRVTMDDNSVFRHPEIEIEVPRDMERQPTELERIAWKIEEGDYRGTGYFTEMRREGEEGEYIAFHGIGGGGAMLAADALIQQGLKIANYADTSGDPTAAKVYRVIKTALAQSDVKGYALMGSVFASQEQWHHAHAIVKAFQEEARKRPGLPVLILIAGNKEKETHEIIKKGLEGLPLRWELYGRDHIYETDFIAQRMKALVKEYVTEQARRLKQ
jgi:succinyl-CoA synthetase beta subunit